MGFGMRRQKTYVKIFQLNEKFSLLAVNCVLIVIEENLKIARNYKNSYYLVDLKEQSQVYFSY